MVQKRTLLKGAAGAGAVTILAGVVPGLRQALAQPAPRVRRRVNEMALDDPDLATYRDFVGILRARPASQRVSWVGFANQHGSAQDFKYCPHGDWYFLPWHRAFVQMYETAAATLTRNPQFAMPYWDWTELRELPAAFTDRTYRGKPNPLYVPGLGDDPSVVRNQLTGPFALTDKLVGPEVIRNIYAETVYELFGTSRSVDRSKRPPQVQDNRDAKWVPMGGGNQGILERTPHNNVHNNIGGYMPESNSPRDPIFMMHHGNIDRIWAGWNALGRQNSDDPLWRDMEFTNNFIAPDGKLYSRTVRDLLDTRALGYTYDRLPAAEVKPQDAAREENVAALLLPGGQARAPRARTANQRSARVRAPLSVAVPLGNGGLEPAVREAVTPSSARDVVAVLSDIQVGPNVLAIRVFVNKEDVTQDVPETDPHFVTRISFLQHGRGAHAGHAPGFSTVVHLDEALQNLARTQPLAGDRISVQLVPVPVPGTPASAVGAVTPGAVEIAII